MKLPSLLHHVTLAHVGTMRDCYVNTSRSSLDFMKCGLVKFISALYRSINVTLPTLLKCFGISPLCSKLKSNL